MENATLFLPLVLISVTKAIPEQAYLALLHKYKVNLRLQIDLSNPLLRHSLLIQSLQGLIPLFLSICLDEHHMSFKKFSLVVLHARSDLSIS
jgi:hypothetical protein